MSINTLLIVLLIFVILYYEVRVLIIKLEKLSDMIYVALLIGQNANLGEKDSGEEH